MIRTTGCVVLPLPRRDGRCSEPLRDPSFPIAVRMLERHPGYAQAAQACPDLADPHTGAPLMPASCNVVLVHGGLSNGLADFGGSLIGGRLPLLAPGGGINIFRYEHDTWLPVEDNVAELVGQVQTKLAGAALLLIGFSRGGIVATRAAARLREIGAVAGDAGPPGPSALRGVRVMTFGSPHRGFGTADIVNRMPRLGYCLQFLVSSALAALPFATRASIFLRSLWRLSQLPPGIANLSPANPEFEQFIRSPAGRWVGRRLHAFGGAPREPRRLPAWCRALLARPVPGIGDGAVSLRSATAYGVGRREVRGCGHQEYFTRAEVRLAIAGHIRQLAAAVGRAFSASPAACRAAS